MKKKALCAAGSLLALLGTEGPAAAAPTLPGAGTLLQEIRPQAPALPGNDPGLSRPAPPPTGLPDSDRFQVNTITITGNKTQGRRSTGPKLSANRRARPLGAASVCAGP